MSKYFTTIDLVEGKFVGTVFDVNTNAEVFKSKPYNSQAQASQEVRGFITATKPTTTEPAAAPGSQAIVNTVKYTSAPSTRSSGRCCGR
jgi:hypothetical protein